MMEQYACVVAGSVCLVAAVLLALPGLIIRLGAEEDR